MTSMDKNGGFGRLHAASVARQENSSILGKTREVIERISLDLLDCQNMRILLASPLYPPDVAEPAPYVKELATRLAREHTVTVLTYGKHPEQIPGVRITVIDKSLPRLTRLSRYAQTLRRELVSADVLYIENGPSVELPALIATLGSRIRIVVHRGDDVAYARAKKSPLLNALLTLLTRRAARAIEEHPLPRPEVNPLLPLPESAQNAYKESWRVHTALVIAACTHEN